MRSHTGCSAKAIAKVLQDQVPEPEVAEGEEPLDDKGKLSILVKKIGVALKKLEKEGKVSREKQSYRNVGEAFEDTTPKVRIEDIEVGEGDLAKDGDKVTVSYKGQLDDSTGAKFDSAKGFAFVIGLGEVISGWEEGIPGMKVGGRRNLHVPWTLGYGKRGLPPDIPAENDLYFEVTLLHVKKVSIYEEDSE